MKKFLVPVDGSKHSEKAILKAKELAELSNGHITLLNVVNDVMINNPYITSREQQEAIAKAFLKEGEEVVKEALEKLEPYTGSVKTLIRYGEADRIIMETAEKDDYDLIIMGSRGLNAFSRAMLGSISNKVVNHARTSVLIVKI